MKLDAGRVSRLEQRARQDLALRRELETRYGPHEVPPCRRVRSELVTQLSQQLFARRDVCFGLYAQR
jgi:hypothetical protein